MDRLSGNGQMISQVDLRGVPHSSFDLRNSNFLSGKLGKLIVSRIDEMYPGDRVKGKLYGIFNFEPLAAPIMGTLVQKQESFFVPYVQLWKNAHNFFTGKKGFNGKMPSVSPDDIFAALAHHGILPDLASVLDYWHNVFASVDMVEDTPVEPQMEAMVEDIIQPWVTSIYEFGLRYHVLDLFNPIKVVLKKYFNIGDDWSLEPYGDFSNAMNDFHFKFNEDYGHQQADYYQFWTWTSYQYIVDAVCDILCSIYKFWFGESSHLDYMGFPIQENLEYFFFNDSREGLKVPAEPIVEYQYYPFNSYRGYTSFRSWLGLMSAEVSAYEDDSPQLIFSQTKLNWLPFRAAYLVWYWNYRDELLEREAYDPEEDDFLGDTPSALEIVLLSIMRVRCWYKDTFTTALTNTGDGNLGVPIAAFSDVSEDPAHMDVMYFNGDELLANTTDYKSAQAAGATAYAFKIGNVSYRLPMNYMTDSVPFPPAISGNVPSLSLDLFDRVRRLRNFVQKHLILGYEYDDVIFASFLVRMSNVRMRIPEILSRGRDVVNINTVVNNTSTEQQIAGDKSATAFVNGSTSGINYFAEEHGFFISYLTILPLQTYVGGLAKMYHKIETFDFMWPEFATMGMDSIYNYELAAPTYSPYNKNGLTDTEAMAVFGYQGRYYDLKSKTDVAHGRFRSDLRYLLFSRQFNSDNPPMLNYEFVHCWPHDLPFVVDSELEDVFKGEVYCELDFERRLPVPSEFV